MTRYMLFVLAVLGTAATAIAAAHPDAAAPTESTRNLTVIKKNSPFPVLGPIIVEKCGVEDCSDVQS